MSLVFVGVFGEDDGLDHHFFVLGDDLDGEEGVGVEGEDEDEGVLGEAGEGEAEGVDVEADLAGGDALEVEVGDVGVELGEVEEVLVGAEGGEGELGVVLLEGEREGLGGGEVGELLERLLHEVHLAVDADVHVLCVEGDVGQVLGLVGVEEQLARGQRLGAARLDLLADAHQQLAVLVRVHQLHPVRLLVRALKSPTLTVSTICRSSENGRHSSSTACSPSPAPTTTNSPSAKNAVFTMHRVIIVPALLVLLNTRPVRNTSSTTSYSHTALTFSCFACFANRTLSRHCRN